MGCIDCLRLTHTHTHTHVHTHSHALVSPQFAVVGKYNLDADASVKAKIDTALTLGLGYTQTIRKGVKIGLFAKVNAAALSSDAHSLGLSLTLEN